MPSTNPESNPCCAINSHDYAIEIRLNLVFWGWQVLGWRAPTDGEGPSLERGAREINRLCRHAYFVGRTRRLMEQANDTSRSGVILMRLHAESAKPGGRATRRASRWFASMTPRPEIDMELFEGADVRGMGRGVLEDVAAANRWRPLSLPSMTAGPVRCLRDLRKPSLPSLEPARRW